MDTPKAAKMAPSSKAEMVDISSTDYTPPAGYRSTAGIYIGGEGILAVDMEAFDAAVSFTCVAGTLLPIQAKKIIKASTSASLIVALY